MKQTTVALTVDGMKISASAGQNALAACLSNNIEVPNLCYDQKLSPAGSCGLCLGSVNGGAPIKLCEVTVEEGMDILTQSDEIAAQRNAALEKLLSVHRGDCVAPCKKACPAGTDCQGYAALIAEGYFSEALRLMFGSYPLPASLGRICPHPCEDACRRSLVDEPVALAALKRAAADVNLDAYKKYLPSVSAPSGKRVAIIGGGPAGLTAAWFLAQKGHEPVIFEAMPQAGGMLRYGIPEFRLPKHILDTELAALEELGVKIRTNTQIGRDMALDDIVHEYDAVFVAVGAWDNAPLQVAGEDLNGVVGGIDVLTKQALGAAQKLGRRVAVVGGGNSAIDACRTALRLADVQDVHLIYRRSREEMPAFAEEVDEAELEGVQFHFLTTPDEIALEDGKLSLKLQKMRLGEPDASGRRRPVPVDGAFESLEVDTLVRAIGQQVNAKGLEALERTAKGTIRANSDFTTNIPGVFAAGDAINNGPGIAVEAIGQAQKAAKAINAYLQGASYAAESPSYVEQNDLTAQDFADTAPAQRGRPAHLPPESRKKNFQETAFAFTQEEAVREAARCLECGCLDLYECRLLAYAQEFGLDIHDASGTAKKPVDKRYPYIFYDANKCTLCGQCVRVCAEIMGYHAWALEGEETPVALKTATGGPLQSTHCIGCGQCVEHCPTGALSEQNPRMKPLAVPPQVHESVCNYCGVGCKTKVYSYGNAPIKVAPCAGGSLEENILCRHGRFGWHTALTDKTLTQPLLQHNGSFAPVSWEEAYRVSLEQLRRIQALHGHDAVGVLVADRMTAEEIYLSRRLGEVLGTDRIYSANIYNGGMEQVFGLDGSTNSYQELADTDLIFILGADVPSYYAMLAIPVQQAVKKGAKLLLAAADGWNGFNMLAHQRAVVEDDTRFLKEMLKALIELGCKPENVVGFEELRESLASVEVSGEAMEFARAYRDAPNAMIMLDRERVSTETARLLSAIAVVAGHIGKPNNGLIQMLQHNNTQCVALMDIRKKMPHLEEDINSGKIKALVLVEQFIPQELAQKLEFTLLLDSMKSPALSHADVFLPMPGYGAFDGTYVSAEGRVQQLNRIFEPPSGKDGYEVLGGLVAAALGTVSPGLADVRKEIAQTHPLLRPCLLEGEEFIMGAAVRYQNGYHFPDGKARLLPAQEKAPLFGDMVFADVPLVTWFGQLVSEGLLQY